MLSTSDLLKALDEYLQIISMDLDQLANKQIPMRLPKFSVGFVSKLAKQATQIFQKEETLLDLRGEFVIVGDIHGHLLDLLRVVKEFDLPPMSNYLFLGDLVDRGEFSIETLVLVTILKVLYPKNVYIVRGNHEFMSVSKNAGFFADVLNMYPSTDLFECFNDMFSFIPLAARLFDKILCLHAGISPGFVSIEQIRSIQRPIYNYDDPVIVGLVWSDPRPSVEFYANSARGSGFFFGPAAFDQFASDNNLSLVIRGHECMHDGWEATFNNRIITVFSCSNYCGAVGNPSAVLHVRNEDSISIKTYPPFTYLTRKDVEFVKLEEGSTTLMTKTAQIAGSPGLLKSQALKKQPLSAAVRLSLSKKENMSRIKQPIHPSNTKRHVHQILKFYSSSNRATVEGNIQGLNL